MKPADFDEYALEPSPYTNIKEAFQDELMHFNDSVWRGVCINEAKPDPEGKIRSGRFVVANNGDLKAPDCRARYVATEVNAYESTDVFAATLPTEAKRLLFSQFASERTRNGQPLLLYSLTPPKRTLMVRRRAAST